MIPLSAIGLPRHKPLKITPIFLLLNILVFAFELLSQNRTQIFYEFGFIPRLFFEHQPIPILTSEGISTFTQALPSWATILSSMFIHGSFMHLASNMLYLWVFGQHIERQLGYIQYTLLYLISGLGASLLHAYIEPSSMIPTVGASGAIAGILGAYIVIYPKTKIRTLFLFVFITVINIPAIYVLGLWFIAQLFNGLGSLVNLNQTNIAYWAHAGGFITGLLLIMFRNFINGNRNYKNFQY